MAIILSETWTHGLLLMPSLQVSQAWHSHLIRLGATAAKSASGPVMAPGGPRWEPNPAKMNYVGRITQH